MAGDVRRRGRAGTTRACPSATGARRAAPSSRPSAGRRRAGRAEPRLARRRLGACRSRSAGSSRAGPDTGREDRVRGSSCCCCELVLRVRVGRRRRRRPPRAASRRRGTRSRNGEERKARRGRPRDGGVYRRVSADPGASRPSRHLHAPSACIRQLFPESETRPRPVACGSWSARCAIVRDGERWLAGGEPAEVVVARGAAAFAALDEIEHGGFWVGLLRVRPRAGRSSASQPRTRRRPRAPRPRVRPLRRRRARSPPRLGHGRRSRSEPGVRASRGREHAARVDAIHELLRAGECYQVNLTRRLTFDAAPDPLALFDALARGESRAVRAACARSAPRCPASRSSRRRPSCSCASTAAPWRPGRSRAPRPTRPRSRRARRTTPRT